MVHDDIEIYKLLVSTVNGVLMCVVGMYGTYAVVPYYLNTKYTSNPYRIKSQVTHYYNENDKIVPIYQFDIEIHAYIEKIFNASLTYGTYSVKVIKLLITVSADDACNMEVFNNIIAIKKEKWLYIIQKHIFRYIESSPIYDSSSVLIVKNIGLIIDTESDI